MSPYPYKFTPKPDISASEIAQILKIGGWLDAKDFVYNSLPESCKRHYEKK